MRSSPPLAIGLMALVLGASPGSLAYAAPPSTPNSATAQANVTPSSDAVPSRPAVRVVYLTTAAALDELRLSNPGHYARAKRILARAEEICKPTAPKLLMLKLDAQSLTCIRSFLFTSYPPQRMLSFQLDDTLYVAMVYLKGDLGRTRPLVQSAPAAGSKP